MHNDSTSSSAIIHYLPLWKSKPNTDHHHPHLLKQQHASCAQSVFLRTTALAPSTWKKVSAHFGKTFRWRKCFLWKKNSTELPFSFPFPVCSHGHAKRMNTEQGRKGQSFAKSSFSLLPGNKQDARKWPQAVLEEI